MLAGSRSPSPSLNAWGWLAHQIRNLLDEIFLIFVCPCPVPRRGAVRLCPGSAVEVAAGPDDFPTRQNLAVESHFYAQLGRRFRAMRDAGLCHDGFARQRRPAYVFRA